MKKYQLITVSVLLKKSKIYNSVAQTGTFLTKKVHHFYLQNVGKLQIITISNKKLKKH